MRIQIKDLAVKRGGRTIFDQVNFDLGPGEVVVVTGANGTGKSTLLRTVAGLLPVSAGSISLTPLDDTPLHEHCHYLGHKNTLKEALTVRENLQFWQSYCGSPQTNIDSALEMVNLAGIKDIPAGYLSAGQKRRIAIARLLISKKPIWLVDEPTAALDKAAEQNFSELLQTHLDGGGLAIAATHQPLDLRNPKMLEMTAPTQSNDLDEAYF